MLAVTMKSERVAVVGETRFSQLVLSTSIKAWNSRHSARHTAYAVSKIKASNSTQNTPAGTAEPIYQVSASEVMRCASMVQHYAFPLFFFFLALFLPFFLFSALGNQKGELCLYGKCVH